jgi:hypothetical protein
MEYVKPVLALVGTAASVVLGEMYVSGDNDHILPFNSPGAFVLGLDD